MSRSASLLKGKLFTASMLSFALIATSAWGKITHHASAHGTAGMNAGDKVIAHYVGSYSIKVDGVASPCDGFAVYNLRANGYAALIIRIGGLYMAFQGNKDRQPDAENYYLMLNGFATQSKMKKSQTMATEGQCHFLGNTAGDEEYSIDCTAYNRYTDFTATLHFSNIMDTQIDINDAAYIGDLPSQARAVQDADVRIAQLSGKILSGTMKKSGMAGVSAEVQACYAEAQQIRSLPKIEQCFMIDFMASEIDSAYVKMIHRPWLASHENEISAVNLRVNQALDNFGFGNLPREKKISQWTNAAPFGLKEVH
jgi:hypothetical protein